MVDGWCETFGRSNTVVRGYTCTTSVVVVVKVCVGTYSIVTIISYLQVNSLLSFTSHDAIA